MGKGLSLTQNINMSIFKHIFFLLFLLFVATSLHAQTPTPAGQQAAANPLSADAVSPLEKGSKIPTVRLTTPEGELFNLNAFVKEQPAVLIFYRGGWCPYCNVHLKELMDADAKLRSLGYQILAASPDKPQKLAESLEKHQMTYRLLSDSAMNAAKAFGVAYQVAGSTVKKYQENGIDLEEASGENHQLLPVPAVFIIDQKGVVCYAYHNPDYKTRIEVEKLLKQAKKRFKEMTMAITITGLTVQNRQTCYLRNSFKGYRML
jgi:peroxiredoxin